MIKRLELLCHLKKCYRNASTRFSDYNDKYFELFNRDKSACTTSPNLCNKLSHVKQDGSVNMVSVSSKPVTSRIAKASCLVNLGVDAYDQYMSAVNRKGDVKSVATLGNDPT